MGSKETYKNLTEIPNVIIPNQNSQFNVLPFLHLFLSHEMSLQGASIGTIKTNANVCCVPFPTDFGPKNASKLNKIISTH